MSPTAPILVSASACCTRHHRSILLCGLVNWRSAGSICFPRGVRASSPAAARIALRRREVRTQPRCNFRILPSDRTLQLSARVPRMFTRRRDTRARTPLHGSCPDRVDNAPRWSLGWHQQRPARYERPTGALTVLGAVERDATRLVAAIDGHPRRVTRALGLSTMDADDVACGFDRQTRFMAGGARLPAPSASESGCLSTAPFLTTTIMPTASAQPLAPDLFRAVGHSRPPTSTVREGRSEPTSATG